MEGIEDSSDFARLAVVRPSVQSRTTIKCECCKRNSDTRFEFTAHEERFSNAPVFKPAVGKGGFVKSLIATCIALGLCPAAMAQLAFEDQVRQISVTTTADGLSESSSAPDFAPFNELVARSVPFQINGVSGTNISIAAISCTLDFEGVDIRSQLEGQGESAVGVSALSDLFVDVTFRVDQPTPYRVRMDPAGEGNPSVEFYAFTLRDADTGAPVLVSSENNTDEFGMLPAGRYQMIYDQRLEASGDRCNRVVRMLMQLTICIGDWDDKLGTDSDDVIAFFADWEAGLGDADADGDSDSDDVILFFARWDQGC